jgi:dihydroneopterin aldolase
VADDVVFLEGMTFHGFHGVKPEERTLGQPFVVDVELAQAARRRDATDDIESTINYGTVYKRVREVVEGPPRDLIETVAEDIAADLLDAFAPATAVTVTVRKPNAPIRGAVFDAAGVRITRTREAGAE